MSSDAKLEAALRLMCLLLLLNHIHKDKYSNYSLQVHSELWQHLQLVHSYLLVRTHVKNNEHLVAARLLIRVAQNISKFPARKNTFLICICRVGKYTLYSQKHLLYSTCTV